MHLRRAENAINQNERDYNAARWWSEGDKTNSAFFSIFFFLMSDGFLLFGITRLLIYKNKPRLLPSVWVPALSPPLSLSIAARLSAVPPKKKIYKIKK